MIKVTTLTPNTFKLVSGDGKQDLGYITLPKQLVDIIAECLGFQFHVLDEHGEPTNRCGYLMESKMLPEVALTLVHATPDELARMPGCTFVPAAR